MAFLLLASLAPVSHAQIAPAPVGATGTVNGIVVDANTREPLVEVINVIVITGAGGVPVPCPTSVVGVNPLTSTSTISDTNLQATINSLTLGGTTLNCTSLSSNIGRWGFGSVPAGVTVQHYGFKQDYSPHSDTFTVVATPAGVNAATAQATLSVQHDFSMALQVTRAGGQAGSTSGTITGTVTFTNCVAPPCVPPNVTPPAPAPGLFPNETALGTLIAAVQVAGPIPGNVVVTTAAANGSFTLNVPASGAAGTWRITAVDPGGGNTATNQPQTAPFCNNGQICGHGPVTAPATVAVAAGATAAVAAGTLLMPLKTAPPSNPAGFTPSSAGVAGSTQNDIGAFGYVVDVATGSRVNGVTVTATCSAGNCANNITAITTNNPNVGGAPDSGSPGYFAMGGLSRGTSYTFRVTAVPAGFRIIDGCQITETTPPAPLGGVGIGAPGTWMDPSLCVESLGVLQPVPGASVLAGRVVDPIQLTAGAPTPLGGVTVVAVRVDASLVGAFTNPFTGFIEAAPTTQTDAGGNWVISGVPPGTYRITALDNVDVLCDPGGTAPSVQLVSIPGGIARPAQIGGCGHIPASQPPAGQPGILAPPDAVTIVPDIVMPPKPAPNGTSLATAGGAATLPCAAPPAANAINGFCTLPAAAGTGGGIFGYVWDGVLGTPSQGATVQVRAVAALGPEVLSGQANIQPNVFLGPQVLPGVAGSPIASGLTSFSGRYEIPGLQPGTAYIVTVTGGIGIPRVEKTVTITAGRWKDPSFVLINTGLVGLPGGPAGGRLELVFPLVSRGGNADIYGVPVETTRIKVQNTGAARTLASIFWCSSTFAVGGVGTADCGAGDSIDLNPAASVAIAPPAGFFGSALVFTSAPPIGPAPGQSPPGAYALTNLEGIAEYLVGDHQSFAIAAGIPAEQLAQSFVAPGNASTIGMAFKNWNPATEWNTVISAMNITNSPQPIVFTLEPTRGVPGGPVQVIRTAPAFGVAVLDLRTVPDIPPRWMGSLWIQSSGGIPPIAQLPGNQIPSTAGPQGLTSAFGSQIQGTATSPIAFVATGNPRANLFLPGGIASSAISYSNRAQMATAVEGIFNSQLVFLQNPTGPPAAQPFAAGVNAVGQVWQLPLVYSGFDGWETGIQVTNQQIGGSISISIEVFNENGQQIETIQDRVANLSGVSYFFGARNAPDYKVGVVRIRPTDGAAPLGVTAQVVNYSRGMAFSYNAFMSLNTSVINIATGAQDVNVALGNETCIGINQPATYIGGQPFQLPVAQCLYVPSVRKDISIDPDTGRVRLGWTSGIRVMHGDDYQPIPIQLTLRYYDPSGFEWIIAREAFVISAPYQAHTTFLGNTASLPAGFDGSAIVTSTSPRVFGLGTVIDYARPSAVPGQPPADRAGGWNLANAAGFIN